MLILSSRQSARGQSGDAPLSLSPCALLLRNNDGTVDAQSPYPSIIIRKEIANDIRILQLLPFWVTTECYRWSDPRSVEPAGPLLGFRRIPSDRRRTAPPYPGWWIAGSHPLPPGFACLIGVPRLGAVSAPWRHRTLRAATVCSKSGHYTLNVTLRTGYIHCPSNHYSIHW